MLEAGGRRMAFHVRGPGTDGRRVFDLTRSLLEGASSAGATLLVNDRVDVALCLGTDGAHLGRRSLPPAEARRILGPERLLGASVHGAEEAEGAEGAETGHVDYLMVGALFGTPSHATLPPRGPDVLRRVRAVVGAPLVGIGGVTAERVSVVVDAGAAGVAAIRGIWDAPSPVGAVQLYLSAFESASKPPEEDPR